MLEPAALEGLSTKRYFAYNAFGTFSEGAFGDWGEINKEFVCDFGG